jgi:hypothetical protein
MNRVLLAVILLALNGCVNTQGVIKLSTPEVVASTDNIILLDNRPNSERNGLNLADCSNFGHGWNGVKDSAFSVSRLDLLRANLAPLLSATRIELKVNHFQTCVLIRSKSGAAAIAGASYIAALALEATFNKQDDVLVTFIDFEINGVRYLVTDTKSFLMGNVFTTVEEKPETAELMAGSTKDAIIQAVEKVRSDLSANPSVHTDSAPAALRR